MEQSERVENEYATTSFISLVRRSDPFDECEIVNQL